MKYEKFTIFEYDSLVEGYVYGGVSFTGTHNRLLQEFYKEEDFPYYKLIRKGVRFCQYVGVLQIGNLIIEVLPKADKTPPRHERELWRKMLLGMLNAVDALTVHVPSFSALSLKQNSILDLYFEIFVTECEQLLHKGLVKKYRKVEGNSQALKGRLNFVLNIQQNLTHKERFYISHTTYDSENTLNCILLKVIKLLSKINRYTTITSRIGNLNLNFPELPDIHVSEKVFTRISYNRKTERYRNAVNIARMILLNLHPDVVGGKHHVLALMFDMNMLWERFVFKSLVKFKPQSYFVTAKSRKHFWRSKGSPTTIIPDIFIDTKDGEHVVLDTKWKNIGGEAPSVHDLRQMYAYSKFYNNAKTALVYPGLNFGLLAGNFLDEIITVHLKQAE